VLTATTVPEWPSDWDAAAAPERCAICGSTELAVESGPRKTLVLMLLLPFPLWFWRSRLTCRSCGASRRIPLRFRPDLVLSWLIAGAAAISVVVLTSLLMGYAAFGQRR